MVEVEEDERVDSVQFIPNSYELLVHVNGYHLEGFKQRLELKGLRESEVKDGIKTAAEKLAINALEWIHAMTLVNKARKSTEADSEKYLEENIKNSCLLKSAEFNEISKNYIKN